MRTWLIGTLILSLGLFLMPVADAGKQGKDDDKDAKAVKEALGALQDFIGKWKNGAATHKKEGTWTEKASWNWRFKGKEAWLSFELENSKVYKGGEVRYLPAKSKYEITLIDKAGKKAAFEGNLKDNKLTVERVNPDTKDTEQLRITLLADGDRLGYALWIKVDGRAQFNKQLEVFYTREGVTFGAEAGDKKPVCVVTGGLGTTTVTYMGVTYWVCCSGCRDAFNENPAKIIAEFNAKKKK
jgi:hypothetical protein